MVVVFVALTGMETVRVSYGSRVIPSIGSASRASDGEINNLMSAMASVELSGLAATSST